MNNEQYFYSIPEVFICNLIISSDCNNELNFLTSDSITSDLLLVFD